MMNVELEMAVNNGAPIEVLMELAGVTEEELYGETDAERLGISEEEFEEAMEGMTEWLREI